MQGIFRPMGPTIPILCTTISTNIALSSLGSSVDIGACAVRCYNATTDNAYLWFTSNSAATQTSWSSGPYPTFSGYPVPQKQIVDYAIGPNCWISGLTTAAAITATVLVTPGYFT